MDRGLREAMEEYGFRYNGERGVYVMDGVGRRMGCREGCAHQAVPEEIVRDIKDRFWKTDYEKCS